MITIEGRTLNIPHDEKFIGVEEDNNVEQRQFQIPDNLLYLTSFKLDFTFVDGSTKTLDLDVVDKVATWTIKREQLQVPGMVKIQLHGLSPEITYADMPEWHSLDAYLKVFASIGATDGFTDKQMSDFEQIEINVTALKNATVAAAQDAKTDADSAKVNADSANAAANVTSLNKDATNADVVSASVLKNDVIGLKDDTSTARDDTLAAEQRVIALMSTDTKSYFFSTISERDACIGLRHCDRCSVLETKSDYIYDMHDTDGDNINPEWILTSEWDALKTVAWEIISGKPEFSKVALSNDYEDLDNKPNRYESFLTVSDGNWDYSLSDKILLVTSNLVSITNVTNGSIGIINTAFDLTLPANSKKSIDYNYVTALTGQTYQYTFLYDGNYYNWCRTVISGAE